MSSPPPKSLVPAPASVPTVWPPSNPSGTVIPFPLPWGQSGCCPPGGMDALMKCYCDLQQASAFIGQVMLDQINNNPAITEAIIAAIEKSGSTLPTIGVTNGSDAQPGQVGEWVDMVNPVPFPTAQQTIPVTMGVLQPGDWTCYGFAIPTTEVTSVQFLLNPVPAGFDSNMQAQAISTNEVSSLSAPVCRALISVPTLVVFQLTTNVGSPGSAAGTMYLTFAARRAR